MLRCHGFLTLICAALLFTILRSPALAPAAEKDADKDQGKVAGILFDKKDNWITVKADGEEAPVKYLVGKDSDKKLIEDLKSIFNASRVQLTYKKEGDSRQLVSIKKQVLKATGTVTGVVVKVYDEFWVEVKPKDGLADAYAPGGNYNDKEFMAKLKGLKAGDSVTIKFTTDGERHRIQTLRINAAAAPKEGKVAGILFDKKDNWITVKADGEDEPVKYLVGDGTNKKLIEDLEKYLQRQPSAIDVQERRRFTATGQYQEAGSKRLGNGDGRGRERLQRLLGRSEAQGRSLRRLRPWGHQLQGQGLHGRKLAQGG